MASLSEALCGVYLDNTYVFPNASNFIGIPYDPVAASFATPYSVNDSLIDGYDWTKPYPGISISSGTSLNDSHAIHLTVALDVPIPQDIVENSTTALSSLTFSIPDNLKDKNGGMKPMDESWFICRHLFISTQASARMAVEDGKGCGFLPDECRRDIRSKLTKDWGRASDDVMCASLTFDNIPESCTGSFGPSSSLMYGFNSSVLNDPGQRAFLTDPKQTAGNWRIGSGYQAPHDSVASEIVSNRTYLVATVWGYGKGVNDEAKTAPDVSLACLSSWSPKVPPTSGANDTSTLTTGSATQTFVSSSSSSVSHGSASTSSTG